MERSVFPLPLSHNTHNDNKFVFQVIPICTIQERVLGTHILCLYNSYSCSPFIFIIKQTSFSYLQEFVEHKCKPVGQHLFSNRFRPATRYERYINGIRKRKYCTDRVINVLIITVYHILVLKMSKSVHGALPSQQQFRVRVRVRVHGALPSQQQFRVIASLHCTFNQIS